MNKYILAFTFLFVSFLSFNLSAQKVRGNGNIVSQNRNVGSFGKVHTYGSYDLVITDANEHKVTVEADENLQQYIIVETEGNTLKIRHQKGVNFNSSKQILIHISAPMLSEVALSGSGNIKSTNQLNGSDKFNISSSGSGNIEMDVETSDMSAAISGSGNISLKGKTKQLDGRISGSGNIRAKNLQSEVTSVRISGSGSAEVVATQKLDTKIAGSGDVRYWGNASVDSKVAGSGSVSRQE